MFLKKIIFCVFLLFPVLFAAQNTDKGKVSYLDFEGKPTTKENAVFYEFKTEYKPGIFKIQKFFLIDYKAYLVEKYYSDDKGRKQGKYTSYFKDGVLKLEGIYKDDLKYGPWKTYKKMPFISMDSINNSTYLFTMEYYKNNVKEGRFKQFFEDGKVYGEGFYKAGKLFGESKWYYRNGQVSQMEIYDDNGKLIELKKWEVNGKPMKVLKKEYKQEGISKQELQEILRFHIRSSFNKNLYNKYPNKPYGTIYIQFRLDKHGRVTLLRIKSTQGVPSEFTDEIIRIFKDIPQQKPIYDHHHQATNTVFTIPFKV